MGLTVVGKRMRRKEEKLLFLGFLDSIRCLFSPLVERKTSEEFKFLAWRFQRSYFGVVNCLQQTGYLERLGKKLQPSN